MATAAWFHWALLSAFFAALTAIFAKIGVAGVDSDLATLIRTVVVLVVLSVFLHAAGKWTNPMALPGKTWAFLVLSGLATGASWVCYFRALKLGDASKVAPVDKLSLVLVAVFAFVFLGRTSVCPRMVGGRDGCGRRAGSGVEAIAGLEKKPCGLPMPVDQGTSAIGRAALGY